MRTTTTVAKKIILHSGQYWCPVCGIAYELDKEVGLGCPTKRCQGLLVPYREDEYFEHARNHNERMLGEADDDEEDEDTDDSEDLVDVDPGEEEPPAPPKKRSRG